MCNHTSSRSFKKPLYKNFFDRIRGGAKDGFYLFQQNEEIPPFFFIYNSMDASPSLLQVSVDPIIEGESSSK